MFQDLHCGFIYNCKIIAGTTCTIYNKKTAAVTRARSILDGCGAQQCSTFTEPVKAVLTKSM